VRYFYRLLLYLIFPYLFLRLYWRSRNLPAYRERLGERLGCYSFTLEKCIWIHAVSVGEVVAAIPLVKALKARYVDIPFLITTMTPTGAARVKAELGESVKHVYLPYDFPFAVKRFLTAMNPRKGIIMETELWPNLVAICHQKKIPLYLLNARLSEKSAQGYRYIAPLMRAMLNQLELIAAQGQADAERFIALGASKERVVVTGNIKFDLTLPSNLVEKSHELRAMLGHNRWIWIAASTHEGEEELLLAAHKKLREKNPTALLILVPRHPQRFNEVATLCEQQGWKIARRSQQQICTSETAVYLGDTMGELLLLYAAAEVAFVAGSLIKHGGHNLLEPAALGKPILTGPHTFNFAEINALFLAANALVVTTDVEALAKELERLMLHPEDAKQLGRSALQVMEANRGALRRQLEIISSKLY